MLSDVSLPLEVFRQGSCACCRIRLMQASMAVYEESCSAHAGTSHGAQSRTGAAAGSDAVVEALSALTLLVTTTLSDASLGPEVLEGLEAQRQPAAGGVGPVADTSSSHVGEASALSALRRMAMQDVRAPQETVIPAPAGENLQEAS